MQDRTINNALLALRRDGGEAQVLAERILALRGVTHLPRMVQNPAARGQSQRIVLCALKDGPKRMPEIAACMAKARPELTPEAAYQRAGQALAKLKLRGLVGREGRVWSLAP